MNVKRTMAMLLLLPSAVFIFLSLQVTHSDRLNALLATPVYVREAVAQPKPPVGGEGGSGKIILMTYGRSGSSFTSDIIQQSPLVFYFFEPLYNLMRAFTSKQARSRTFMLKDASNSSQFIEQSVELIETFLNCGFEAMDVKHINNYQLRNSADSRLLWDCVQKKSNWSPMAVMDCFIKARRTCMNRPIKMVKTIRLRGSGARMIMDKHQDLKLLYLIRDPRGTLTSQHRVFNAFKWDEVGNFSADYCTVFREDLEEVGQLLERYPQRVKVLRYETLAENPVTVTEEMYRFLGLNFTSEIKEFVFNKTNAGRGVKISAYGTARINSTETASSWRRKLTLAAAQTIDNNCKEVYQSLGYLPVESQTQLIDMSHELKIPVQFHGRWL